MKPIYLVIDRRIHQNAYVIGVFTNYEDAKSLVKTWEAYQYRINTISIELDASCLYVLYTVYTAGTNTFYTLEEAQAAAVINPHDGLEDDVLIQWQQITTNQWACVTGSFAMPRLCRVEKWEI